MEHKMNKNEVKQRSKTKYQVASDSLLADIESGKLRPGDRLPSEDQLVSQLGFSFQLFSQTSILWLKPNNKITKSNFAGHPPPMD